MKKIFTVLLLIIFVFQSSSLAFAAEAFKVVKQDGKYGLIDNNRKVILPYEYDSIKKITPNSYRIQNTNSYGVALNTGEVILPVKYSTVKVLKIKKDSFLGYNDAKHSIFFAKEKNSWLAFTPTRQADEFFKRTYNYNNKVSWVKFYNYPTKGILQYKVLGKYGLVISTDNEVRIIEPKFDEFYFQDKNSAIFKQFNISFTNPDAILAKKNGKWGVINRFGEEKIAFKYDSVLMADAIVQEDVEFNNDTISFTFKGIELPMEDRVLVTKKNLRSSWDWHTMVINKMTGITYINVFSGYKRSIVSDSSLSDNFLQNAYQKNNKTEFIKFSDYPLDGIKKFKDGSKYGLMIRKNGEDFTIPAEYQDFYFQDSHSAIYQKLGISYSNPDLIIAKKDGKWGIIDKDNKIVDTFKYTEVVTLNAITREKIDIDLIKNIISIKYQGSEFPSPEIVLVSQNDKFGVIKRDGSILIPLKYPFVRPQSAPKSVESVTNSKILYGSANEVYSLNDMVNDRMKKSTKDFSETMKKVVTGVLMFPLYVACGAVAAPFIILFMLALGGGC